jgi:5-dehydro-4-deoxyglucarate dehydratase
MRGRPVGPVRAPLTEPSPADLADLEALLAAGLALASGLTPVGAAL